MTDPLRLLDEMIEAMQMPCPPCGGTGTMPNFRYTTRTEYEASVTTDLPPALAKIAMKSSPPFRSVPVEDGERKCITCHGARRVVSAEGHAVLERLAHLLVPLLDHAVAPAPHDHEQYEVQEGGI